MFLTYWPCGNCVAGGSIDDGKPSEFSGEMLMQAAREGRCIGYLKDGEKMPVLVWKCECVSTEMSGEARE